MRTPQGHGRPWRASRPPFIITKDALARTPLEEAPACRPDPLSDKTPQAPPEVDFPPTAAASDTTAGEAIPHYVPAEAAGATAAPRDSLGLGVPDHPAARRLRHRPVRVWLGLLTGLVFGPLLAALLVHLPGSGWLGPYPAYPQDATFMAATIGLLIGPPVGLVVALLGRMLQGWKHGRGVGHPRSAPVLPWPAAASEAIRAGVGLSPHPDEAGPPADGISPTRVPQKEAALPAEESLMLGQTEPQEPEWPAGVVGCAILCGGGMGAFLGLAAAGLFAALLGIIPGLGFLEQTDYFLLAVPVLTLLGTLLGLWYAWRTPYPPRGLGLRRGRRRRPPPGRPPGRA